MFHFVLIETVSNETSSQLFKEPIAVGVISAIVSAIVSGLAGYYIGLRKIIRQHFLQASETFRNAFTEEIAVIRSYRPTGVSDSGKVEHILKPAAKKHFKAMVTFKEHLPARKRESFEAAWERYCGQKDKETPVKAGMSIYRNAAKFASPGIDEDAKREEYRIIELALKNIDDLFKFAKP